MPENYDWGVDDIPPNLSPTEIYAQYVLRVQANEATEMRQACSEAWQACRGALLDACERQDIDASYDLAIIGRQSRSWRPSIRSEAAERLELIFETLAERDYEFSVLYERCENLEEAVASLDERHAEERWRAGINQPRPALTERILRLLHEMSTVLSERPRR